MEMLSRVMEIAWKALEIQSKVMEIAWKVSAAGSHRSLRRPSFRRRIRQHIRQRHGTTAAATCLCEKQIGWVHHAHALHERATKDER